MNNRAGLEMDEMGIKATDSRSNGPRFVFRVTFSGGSSRPSEVDGCTVSGGPFSSSNMPRNMGLVLYRYAGPGHPCRLFCIRFVQMTNYR